MFASGYHNVGVLVWKHCQVEKYKSLSFYPGSELVNSSEKSFRGVQLNFESFLSQNFDTLHFSLMVGPSHYKSLLSAVIILPLSL